MARTKKPDLSTFLDYKRLIFKGAGFDSWTSSLPRPGKADRDAQKKLLEKDIKILEKLVTESTDKSEIKG